MKKHVAPRPRVLVVDDLFGRQTGARPNRERQNLCGHLLLNDVSADAAPATIVDPVADAVFFRGQKPLHAEVGDVVENDLVGVVSAVERGWSGALAPDRRWSMVLLDLCFYTGEVTADSDSRTAGMPEGRAEDDIPDRYFGLVVLEALKKRFPALPIVVVSSKPRNEVAYDVSKHGAVGFIDRDDLRAPDKLRDALQQHALFPSAQIVGRSLSILETVRDARRAAATGHHIAIVGERGSGRKTLARYISSFDASRSRSKRPFVRAGSALVGDFAVASDFFGREGPSEAAGSLSLLEEARHGDLLFEDAAQMSQAFQLTLLRAIEEGRVRRVGAKSARPFTVRFLSVASESLLRDSAFNADLLEALSQGGVVHVAPLRDRAEDIADLARRFLEDALAAHPRMRPKALTEESVMALADYEWPGNVQELRTIVTEAAIRFPETDFLMPLHFRLAASRANENRPAALRDAESPVLIEDLISEQTAARFDMTRPMDWSGRMIELQHAQSWAVARLLEAALLATRRLTPQHPDGILLIHPAVKLATGVEAMTAAEAADTIKRILSPLEDELEGVLREALDISLRLRPRSGRRRAAT